MSDVDWTTVLSYLVGGSGTLTLVAVAWIQSRRKHHPKEVEDKAAAESNTYAAPGNDTNTVNGLISLANEVGNLSKRVAADGAKLEAMDAELKGVKQELGMLRKSYTALYWWSIGIVNDWEALRENVDPPALPTDIHHP